LKLKAVRICYESAGAGIVATELAYGEAAKYQGNTLYEDFYVRSSPDPTCYEATLSTPTVIPGSLYLRLGLFFDSNDAIWLYSVRVTLET
jgi:hypothetical protein